MTEFCSIPRNEIEEMNEALRLIIFTIPETKHLPTRQSLREIRDTLTTYSRPSH